MKKVLIILLIVFAVGCAKKHVKTAGEAVEGQGVAGETAVSGKEVVEDKIYTGGREGDIASETEDITAGEAVSDDDVLFDYDKYDIRADARPVLETVAAWMRKHRGVSITIEGHCDERGTNQYNLALGEKRAKAARDYLSSLGISSGRMSLITYGEESPLCSESNESCWQSNRRAHFIITK